MTPELEAVDGVAMAAIATVCETFLRTLVLSWVLRDVSNTRHSCCVSVWRFFTSLSYGFIEPSLGSFCLQNKYQTKPFKNHVPCVFCDVMLCDRIQLFYYYYYSSIRHNIQDS